MMCIFSTLRIERVTHQDCLSFHFSTTEEQMTSKVSIFELIFYSWISLSIPKLEQCLKEIRIWQLDQNSVNNQNCHILFLWNDKHIEEILVSSNVFFLVNHHWYLSNHELMKLLASIDHFAELKNSLVKAYIPFSKNSNYCFYK